MTVTNILDQFIDAIADRVVEKIGQTVVEPVEEKQPKTKKPAKPKVEKADKSKMAEPELSLPDVRAKLAKISRSGKQQEVKDLLTSFDVQKLTDLDPSHYTDILEKAGSL